MGYCRYFDKTFTAILLVLSLLWLYLGNSQVSVYRTIGPTLVFNCPARFPRAVLLFSYRPQYCSVRNKRAFEKIVIFKHIFLNFGVIKKWFHFF